MIVDDATAITSEAFDACADALQTAARGLRNWAEREPPAWGYEPLRAFNRADFAANLQPFATHRTWSDRHALNIYQIVGTAHPDYQGLSWLDLLRRGRRMDGNLAELAANPGYYLADAVKLPAMSFISTDGHDWYVDHDGNHRTCIARFLFARLAGHGAAHTRTVLTGLTVHQYDIDRTLKAAFDALTGLAAKQAIPVRIGVEATPLGRTDAAGWKTDTYAPRLRLQGPRADVLLDAEGAQALLERWRRRVRRGWLGRALGGEWL